MRESSHHGSFGMMFLLLKWSPGVLVADTGPFTTPLPDAPGHAQLSG